MYKSNTNHLKTNLQPDIALVFQFSAIGVDFIDDELLINCLYVVVTFIGFVIVEVEFKDFDEDDLRNDGFDAGVGLIVLFLR